MNRDLEALRHMLFWAVDEGILLSNPLSRVLMVRERRKPRLMLTVTEEDKLLAAAAPHLRSIVIAALDSGMRRGEILTERWQHVDFTRKILYVTHSKTAGGEAREIPLTERLLTDLAARRKPEGIVFTFDNQPISRIKTAWKGALRRAPDCVTYGSTTFAMHITHDCSKPECSRRSERRSWVIRAAKT